MRRDVLCANLPSSFAAGHPTGLRGARSTARSWAGAGAHSFDSSVCVVALEWVFEEPLAFV